MVTFILFTHDTGADALIYILLRWFINLRIKYIFKKKIYILNHAQIRQIWENLLQNIQNQEKKKL